MKGSTLKDFPGFLYRKEGSDPGLGNSSELNIIFVNTGRSLSAVCFHEFINFQYRFCCNNFHLSRSYKEDI
jgi:hypothetical protein